MFIPDSRVGYFPKNLIVFEYYVLHNTNELCKNEYAMTRSDIKTYCIHVDQKCNIVSGA